MCRLAETLCAVLLLAQNTFGQTATGFDLERLTHTPGSANSWLLATGDGLERGAVRVSLTGHYEHHSLLLKQNGVHVGAIVSSRVTAHLGLAVGVTDWLEIGLSAPFVVSQQGDSLGAQGFEPLSRASVGSPVISARSTFWRQNAGALFDVGASLGVSAPFGSTQAYTRDPGLGLAVLPRVGAGRRFGNVARVGVELGIDLRGQQQVLAYSANPGNQIGSMLSVGATATTLGKWVRVEADARALVPLAGGASALELLGGLRSSALKEVEFFAVGGLGVGQLAGTPQFRVLAGLSWAPGSDQCFENEPYPLAQCPHLDRDHDRVANGVDACPETFGERELEGCPAEPVATLEQVATLASDADADGIENDLDECVSVAGPAPTGCPTELDEAAVPTIDSDDYLFDNRVHFELGKAELDESAREALAALADALAHRPTARLVVVGHADITGPSALNRRLSIRRAAEVCAALVILGVDASRIEVQGLGATLPLASNTTGTGRALNRRVEFVLHRVTHDETTSSLDVAVPVVHLERVRSERGHSARQ